MTPNKDTLEKINEILANYEFQVIAMKDDDTGESQRDEARTALYKLWLGERLAARESVEYFYKDSDLPAQILLEAIVKDNDAHMRQLQALIDGENQEKGSV